ncbi:hypothetical protein C2S53_009185 [Perilla frutescens var. hirtella]|uniref:RRM domain-containing protein n=1 Tax=Perilla frutescens var. hirtella TaxID=608512 RepID=A0AAD4JK97_PERFH|nr:hypothetical protein C2S53_009185 [Perilla frutescens var. hirtella]
MKQSSRLSSAVFQLTPTRTRCDLIIISNDKKEKIASGLLNPFLAHLKTAQDQIAKGGYSILLEPETGSDTSWFTKATLERFVRFVSTPEILERVYTIETEILQIGEAIALQSSNDIGQSIAGNHQRKSLGGYEGGKSVQNADDEKAIVLYTPGVLQPEANGSCSQEENSKVQLLKVLETRKIALQKEQGMAFARAVAAGFDIDHVAALVSFAECFGAMRLMEACSRFMDLWKCKHETGQWLDIEASEALSTQLDFSAVKASGIVLSGASNNQDESYQERASENNGKSGSNAADNPVSNGQQEHFQGQYPHLVFPPWSMHAPPGPQPVFQAYPVQGMPYYHSYAGNGPFVQPHHYSLEHSPSNLGSHPGQNRLDVRDSNNESEMRETGRSSSLDDTASDGEASHSRRSRKKAGGSNKKKPGMVVIRNVNFITSKEKKSGSETNSESHSDVDTENENVDDDGEDVIHQKRSSKSGGSQLRSGDKLNFHNDEVSILGKDTDDRHWQAFQDCLLRGNDEDAQADNEGMFAMEKGVKLKRHANTASDDSLALCARDGSEMQDNRMKDIQRISGSASRRLRGYGGEVQFSSKDNDFRGSDDQTDIQFDETNGKKILYRTAHEDYMIGNQRSQANFRNSSDPLALNRFETTINQSDRELSSGMADETLIGPLRSMSLDQDGRTDRTVIDMDSEIPSKYQKSGPKGTKNKVEYEPNDLSLMPERRIDKRPIEYDPALDYEMQVCAEVSEKKRGKDVTNNVKGGLKKSDKDRRSKVTSDSLQKQRTGGPMRKTKPSKVNPLEDARARAEKLRAYKADLQKMKKEQEEAQMKRLEALKLERQKRIAARGGPNAIKPSTPSPQAKQVPTKPSAATNRGSKFSDSEPGSSSPLQRSKVRTSVGSGVSHKASKASILSEGSPVAGNRLVRSSSSLSDTKREINGITPDSKASMSRIRRLSEPKTITNPPVITMKTRSAEAVLKRKLLEGPERNKVSAIINLDRSKAATLPELKIKTTKLHVNADENTSAVKDIQKVNGVRPSVVPEKAELNAKTCSQRHELDVDENPIVEKTVVVLECEKPSAPTLQSPERKQQVKSSHAEKDPPNFASTTASEQPYMAPYARISSLEDPSTHRTEYVKAPLVSPGLAPRAEETLKALVPDVKAIKVDKNQVSSEKTSVKEPSKGLRRLLMFGKKNHSSSSVDRSVDSECTSGDGIEHDDNARKTISTGEVHTLKNLISQDETSTDGNAPQKRFSAARVRFCSSVCSDGVGDSRPQLKEEAAAEDPKIVSQEHIIREVVENKLGLSKETSLGNVMAGYSGPCKPKSLSDLFMVPNDDPIKTMAKNEGRELEEPLMDYLSSQSNGCQKVLDLKYSSMRSANDHAAMETDRPMSLASVYRSSENSNESREEDAEKNTVKDLVECIRLQNVAPNTTEHCSSTGLTKGISLSEGSHINANMQRSHEHDRLHLLPFPAGTSTVEDMETSKSGFESVHMKELKKSLMVSSPISNKGVDRQRQRKNSARTKSEGNDVIVRFLRSSISEREIFKHFSSCGEIKKIEYPDVQLPLLKTACINFKTREGLEKAIDISGSHFHGRSIIVESATSENRTPTIPVPSLLGDPDIPAALVKNPTRTIRIERLTQEISSCHIVEALAFCKSNVSGYFLGSSHSVAYVELETEIGKERALAKQSINVLGKHLVMLRIDCPRTTAVRISSTESLKLNDALSICKSLGDINSSLPRASNMLDVYFKLAEWPNMLKILNRLNGCTVEGRRLQAAPAPVFPPEVLLALWRHPEERKHVKATALALLHKLELNAWDTSELAFLENDFFST